MKHLSFLAAALAVTLPHFAFAADPAPKKLLVVSVTTGFRHSSIETGEKIIQKLADESKAFTVDYVKQPAPKPDEAQLKAALAKLGADSLKNYDGLLFLNTTGDLPIPDKAALLAWIRSGKGFIGAHSATDTFHGWPEFIEMLGGEFQGHGAQVEVECINQDANHPATRPLGPMFKLKDEIYLLKNFTRSKVHGLLTLDKHPNDKTPGDFPIAWSKEYGSGRVFYTSLGHREDVWDAETPDTFKRENSAEVAAAYQKHLLGGIKWALGLEAGDAKPPAK